MQKKGFAKVKAKTRKRSEQVKPMHNKNARKFKGWKGLRKFRNCLVDEGKHSQMINEDRRTFY